MDRVRLYVRCRQICIMSEASDFVHCICIKMLPRVAVNPTKTRVTLHYFCGGLTKLKGADQLGFLMEPSEPCRLPGPRRQDDVTLSARGPDFRLDGSEAIVDVHDYKLIMFS